MASIHYTVGREFVKVTEKSSMADDDRFLIEDSENEFHKRQLKGSAIKDKVLSGGLDQTIAITDSGGTIHTMVFTNGILTSYTTA